MSHAFFLAIDIATGNLILNIDSDNILGAAPAFGNTWNNYAVSYNSGT